MPTRRPFSFFFICDWVDFDLISHSNENPISQTILIKFHQSESKCSLNVQLKNWIFLLSQIVDLIEFVRALKMIFISSIFPFSLNFISIISFPNSVGSSNIFNGKSFSPLRFMNSECGERSGGGNANIDDNGSKETRNRWELEIHLKHKMPLPLSVSSFNLFLSTLLRGLPPPLRHHHQQPSQLWVGRLTAEHQHRQWDEMEVH